MTHAPPIADRSPAPFAGFHLHQIEEAHGWLNRAFNAVASDGGSRTDALSFTESAHERLKAAIAFEGPGIAIGAAEAALPSVRRAAELLAATDAAAGAQNLGPVLDEFTRAMNVLEKLLDESERF